jgi:hypothetical protein
MLHGCPTRAWAQPLDRLPATLDALQTRDSAKYLQPVISMVHYVRMFRIDSDAGWAMELSVLLTLAAPLAHEGTVCLCKDLDPIAHEVSHVDML